MTIYVKSCSDPTKLTATTGCVERGGLPPETPGRLLDEHAVRHLQIQLSEISYRRLKLEVKIITHSVTVRLPSVCQLLKPLAVAPPPFPQKTMLIGLDFRAAEK